MKILLSAYACEPNKGSEPGVGWSWAQELAKHHTVWVLTRDNNEPVIEAYLQAHPQYRNEKLHFIYIGLPRSLTFWKKGRRGMRLFYMLWQKKAYKTAKRLSRTVKFDLVQHVTFASCTQPTYLYRLGIPFIWGPVGGGENIPAQVHISMSMGEHILEIMRRLSQRLLLLTPSSRGAMRSANYILTATEETRARIPLKYREKTLIMPAIGLEGTAPFKECGHGDGRFRIIMAGRLIYWKAADIGVRAFLQLADQNPNAELHILGEGSCKEKLKAVAGKYLNQQIFLDRPVEHDGIFDYYRNFDLFINTSLRDSGCMTMMEAMSVGLPCIAVAAGGPAVLLGPFDSCKVQPGTVEHCVRNLAEKMQICIADSAFRHRIAAAQYEYVKKTLLMENKVEKIEKLCGAQRKT